MELAEPGILQTILTFLVLITILVFVHEWGHYAVARHFGVKVDVFSIGFGPEIYGWTDKKGTRWKISLLPLGGYVRFFGDASAASTPAEEIEHMTPEEREVSFHHKPLLQKAAVIFAGPGINLLFAIVIYAVMFMSLGMPYTAPIITAVEEGSPAEVAGLQPGDEITAIDGDEIQRFEDLRTTVVINTGTPLDLTVLRDGQSLSIPVTPQIVEVTDRFGNTASIGRLGVVGQQREIRELGPLESIRQAFVTTGSIIDGLVTGIGQLVRGWRSLDELAGPIRIAKVTGEQATLGFIAFVEFLALISINLGLVNLLPIPLLDGGHLLFYGLEGVRGKPLHPKFMELAYFVGLALVLSLFLLVTWNDITSLNGG